MAFFIAVHRTALIGIACLAALAGLSPAFAQQYPDKPVKIIIPFPAGGVTDIAGRLIAQKLSEKLGQQFYIENIAAPAATSAWRKSRARPATATRCCSLIEHHGKSEPLHQERRTIVEKDFIPVTKAGALAELLADQSGIPGQNDDRAGRR